MSSSAARTSALRLGKMAPKSTRLFLCDMQEKFRPMISHFDDVVHNSNRVLRASAVMDVSAFATEQYPKGLGRTVPELGLEEHGIAPVAKTCFTMVVPELEKSGLLAGCESVVLCGIEAHACIHHTTLDLLELGLDVHIPVDCVSSRTMTDRVYALRRLRDSGAFLTTSECVILGFAADAAHPNFRQLQKIVMQSAPDTGLVGADI